MRELLLASPERSIEQMARETGRCRRRTARLLRLAFVAPSVFERVIEGEHAPVLASKGLAAAVPACWRAQEQVLLAR